jgi:septal ring factor EnvC (AmiA/AmiB activator)
LTGAGPDPPAVPPSRPDPVTADELRAIRRWLLVAGVWAAAATAIAVIALINANEANNDEQNARTAGQLTRVQRQLSDRLDELDGRISDLAPATDVSKLDQRLKKIESSVTKTSNRLEALGKDVDDVQSRVDDLEQQAQSNTDTTGTDTTQTTP